MNSCVTTNIRLKDVPIDSENAKKLITLVFADARMLGPKNINVAKKMKIGDEVLQVSETIWTVIKSGNCIMQFCQIG